MNFKNDIAFVYSGVTVSMYMAKTAYIFVVVILIVNKPESGNNYQGTKQEGG